MEKRGLMDGIDNLHLHSGLMRLALPQMEVQTPLLQPGHCKSSGRIRQAQLCCSLQPGAGDIHGRSPDTGPRVDPRLMAGQAQDACEFV